MAMIRYNAIVIGVSSGGMNALSLLLPLLQPGLSMPVIIVQHIAPHAGSDWIGLLKTRCSLLLKEADEKEKIESGTIYTAPPNYHLLIENDYTFSLSIDEKVNFARPAIDVLFESAAEAYRERLIGIVLTGANHDGAAGLQRIQQLGGLTIVQDPATAQTPAMPAAALNRLKPDYVLPLDQIGHLLNQLAQRP